jgi:hypothetical protein
VNTSFLVQTRRAGSNCIPTVTAAQTPEELEMLFEDAFVLRDHSALARLFDAGAVVAASGRATVQGAAIEPLIAELWALDATYLAQPRHIVQAREIALVVAERAISVVRRTGDGGWRYAIALLDIDKEETT